MTGLIGETLTLPDESYLVSDTLLGKGGFASVYLAWSSKGESVAIKAVDCNKQSAWAIGKLRTEATALKRAQQHENIVQLFGELRVGQYHVFVLEAWGQDLLDQVLEYKGLGEQRALNVMAQVLRALEWLHERRICHGDVKPENLLTRRINGVDVVKLADFGSAVELPPSGVVAVDPVAQGTTLYSPPEVLHGQAYSCGVDVWAAGISCYVLISGFFPFGNTADAIGASASFEGEGWRDVSEYAQSFIDHLLRHEPSERPSAAAAQRHAWFRNVTTPPPPAAIDSLPPTPVTPPVDEAPVSPPPMKPPMQPHDRSSVHLHSMRRKPRIAMLAAVGAPPQISTYTPANTPTKRRAAADESRWPAKKRAKARGGGGGGGGAGYVDARTVTNPILHAASFSQENSLQVFHVMWTGIHS